LTHIEEVYQTNIKLLVVRVAIFPSIVLLNGLSYLVVLFYGGHETIAGRLTIGDIMAFNIYIAMLSFPLTAVGIIISIYQRAKTAIERLAELDDETPEAAIPNLNGNHPDDDNIILEVKNLSFQYPKGEEAKGDSDDFVLKQISFQVRQGQKIGITGPVGSGKSTLFEVITRLYDPPPGTIFWRGQDILSLDPQTLRQHIGYTKQNAHLMSDTVANNLAYGTAFRQDQSKLEEAARRASVLHDIEKLPEAWNTEIGERGVRLSGGQKQRLALARIFLREPELLILDDTMSAVDQSTEQRMIQYILASNQTVILTSHRNSALQHCDLIIVMRQGKIDCLGSYETMKKCGDLNFLAS
jgi:ATP-binding cassette subfamily B protein